MSNFTTGCDRCDKIIIQKHDETRRLWSIEAAMIASRVTRDGDRKDLKETKACLARLNAELDQHLAETHVLGLPF